MFLLKMSSRALFRKSYQLSYNIINEAYGLDVWVLGLDASCKLEKDFKKSWHCLGNKLLTKPKYLLDCALLEQIVALPDQIDKHIDHCLIVVTTDATQFSKKRLWRYLSFLIVSISQEYSKNNPGNYLSMSLITRSHFLLKSVHSLSLRAPQRLHQRFVLLPVSPNFLYTLFIWC